MFSSFSVLSSCVGDDPKNRISAFHKQRVRAATVCTRRGEELYNDYLPLVSVSMATSSSSSDTSERPDVPAGLAKLSPDGMFAICSIGQSVKLAIATSDETARTSCETGMPPALTAPVRLIQ